jgi:hypothetical protein
MDFRGRGGDQVLNPGGGGANLGDRGPASRPNVADRTPGSRPSAGTRPSPGANRPAANRPQRDSALGNIQSGRATNLQSARGRASLGGGGGGARVGGGGGARVGGGGGGARGGGGRRSDIRLKHDIVVLGHLDNGLGFYRFIYNGGDKAYVGVMAQEVQAVMPEAVVVGRNGYLLVRYDKLGIKLQTYDRWITSGARVPTTDPILH